MIATSNRLWACALVVTFALGGSLIRIEAQTTFGTILGTLRDPSGLPVPGVKVAVRNEGTNISHQSTTDDRGDYSVSHLIPGVYSVTAEHAGFKKYTKTSVILETAATVRADVPQIGRASCRERV